MERKWISFLILGACLLLIFSLSKILKSELAPLEDHSNIRVNITAPEGAGFDYTSDLLDSLSQNVTDITPEARIVYERMGGGFVVLTVVF